MRRRALLAFLVASPSAWKTTAPCDNLLGLKTCKNGHRFRPNTGRGCTICAKAKAAEYREFLKKDPVRLAAVRKRNADYRRKRYAEDAEWRARLVRHTRQAHERRKERDPGLSDRLREYHRAHYAKKSKSAAYKALLRERTRLRRSDPEYKQRERLSAIEQDRLRNADPEFRKRKSAYMRERFQRQAVRELHRTNNHRRRARVAGAAAPGVSAEQWARICARFSRNGKVFCAYCKRVGPVTVEHVVPIARGGPDAPSNVRPACKRCNCSKRDRLISEWHLAPKLLTANELRSLIRLTQRLIGA